MLKIFTKKKAVFAIFCSFVLLCIFNLLTEQLFLKKIYYTIISSSPLYCYRIPGTSLKSILEVDPPKGKSIFFHETSCSSHKNGKLVIERRQACAVESAAKSNENRSIYILFTSPGVVRYERTQSDNIISALLSYKNINLLRVNLDNYTRDTPVQNIYEQGHIEYSQYAQSHMSDLLRYVTLWKYGGIYLDLDVIVIKSFTNLSENFAGAESKTDVAAGVLSFGHDGIGHEYASACLDDLRINYKYNDWGYNGPGVITRLLQQLCGTEKAQEMLNLDCKGFKVYPPSYFYPVPWRNWKMYFKQEDNDEVLHLSETSYTIHIWNKHSLSKRVPHSSNVSYVILARKFCPKVYEASEGYF